MPFAGEILPLSFQLLDGDSSKYARAILTDETGTPLAGSPVSLPHIGGGKYSSDAVLMPVGVEYVEATYQSFDDALFTVPDPDHLLGTDVFRLEIPDQVIVDKLNQIIAKLEGIALPGAAIDAVLVQNKISDVIDDAKMAKALIERDNIKGIVENDPTLNGCVNQNQITGVIDE